MKFPKVTRWAIEGGVLDLAAAILMVRWIRRRGEQQSLRVWQPMGQMPGVDDALGMASDAAGMPFGKYKKVSIVVDLLRRLVGSQAFFFLVAACFNPHSWLGREIRSFWGMIWRKPRPQLTAGVTRPPGIGRILKE
jgi:hypothetical protein